MFARKMIVALAVALGVCEAFAGEEVKKTQPPDAARQAASNLAEAKRLNEEAGKRLTAIQIRLDALAAKVKAKAISSVDFQREFSALQKEVNAVARMQAEAGLRGKPAAKPQAKPEAKEEATAKAVAKGSGA